MSQKIKFPLLYCEQDDHCNKLTLAIIFKPDLSDSLWVVAAQLAISGQDECFLLIMWDVEVESIDLLSSPSWCNISEEGVGGGQQALLAPSLTTSQRSYVLAKPCWLLSESVKSSWFTEMVVKWLAWWGHWLKILEAIDWHSMGEIWLKIREIMMSSFDNLRRLTAYINVTWCCFDTRRGCIRVNAFTRGM